MGIWLLQLFTFLQPGNPAQVTYAPFRGAAVAYDQAFGVPEWSGTAAWAGFAVRGLPLETGVSAWGSDLWRELEVRARSGVMQPPFHLGLGINHRLGLARGYAPLHHTTVDAGLAVDAGERLRLGYLQTNLLATPGLETWSALEADWAPLPGWHFGAGAWHRRHGPPDLVIHTSWNPRPDMGITVARRWDPGIWQLGFRYDFGRVRTGLGTRSHPDLGWSRTAEVIWE